MLRDKQVEPVRLANDHLFVSVAPVELIIEQLLIMLGLQTVARVQRHVNRLYNCLGNWDHIVEVKNPYELTLAIDDSGEV